MQDQQPEEENPRKTSQIQNEAVNFQNLFYINKSEIQKAFNEKLAEGETKITLMQAKELTQELEAMLNKQFNGMEIEIDNEAEKHQQDGEYDFTLSFEEYYALLQIWAENEDTKEDNQNVRPHPPPHMHQLLVLHAPLLLISNHLLPGKSAFLVAVLASALPCAAAQ